jgi:hypothetical protein
MIVKLTWRRKWYKDCFSFVRHVGHEPRVVVGAISKFEIVINTKYIVTSFFEAAGAIVKLGLSLKLSHHSQNMRFQFVKPSVGLTIKVNFINMFTYSFYIYRSQKSKKTVKSSVSFCAFGI